ncbi:MAG TPA: multidrug efflux RND transporter permease subunit [Casimicrobiaceae bacterium]|jgi:HAE1 family hydrophobic/amphiphilic exporter-1/multidrug efflux pump|nr:multidrug efflux RND transporter permease subunit [Casimicrobiaceae bacterium]
MSFSEFFINRPIFAGVISIIITLGGLIAARVLPVAQYPEIAPPTVIITANYPGASADTLARTVAAPIEEQLSGVDNLSYFSSTASTNGSLTIACTFEVGANADKAVIDVNNRVAIALPRLPEVVRQTGVVALKRSTDILLVIGLSSDDPRYDTLYLSNYATINVLDELKRIPGVADVTIFGARDYSMRVWLNPAKMAQLGVTPTDVAQAIGAQNTQYAAGKIGAEPAPAGQALVYTVTARGRLEDPADFGNIVLRATGPGGALRIRDVARIELGAVSYDAFTNLDGKPTVGIAVFLQSGANALKVADSVRTGIAQLAQGFPQGVTQQIPFDTTRFVQASIHEVIITLIAAAILVLLVVFVFLQSWRATLIPIIAVPVSLIGAFGGLLLFGFTLNTLTLFAIVLATGIVVDDAIVVLENVERLMAERKLSPKEAAIESMREVTGAIVAIELVLVSVFIPVAFLGGLAGKLYQQFAVTVATAVTISGLVALTLSPAMCALLLKPQHIENRLFRPFNRSFAWLTRVYLSAVRLTARHAVIGVLIFAGILGVDALLFKLVPNGFVPPEDQGYVLGSLALPDAATLQRTQALGAAVQKMLLAQPSVEHVFVVSGFDVIGGANRANAATIFIPLKPWDERKTTAQELAKSAMAQASELPQGALVVFNPASIRGLGIAGGFEVYLQDRADADPLKLYQGLQQFLSALRKRPELTGIASFYRPTSPQLFVDVDREKAMSLGVPVQDVFDALQSTMGVLYVNDFNKFGHTYRVQLQADGRYRSKPEDLGNVYVRSAGGDMIPVKALISLTNTIGPEQLDRYNGFLAAKVLGNSAPGVSSGQAIAAVEDVARSLPPGYTIAWTGQAFQEKRIGTAAILAFSFAIVMVFLILSANYERWSLPAAVLLAVPFGLLGALTAVFVRDFSNDVYFQIGLLVLIGLAAKNAILIVEFAAQEQAKGLSPIEAAFEAARLRFRPIVMTSLAFVLGVVPLVLATGAGASARRSMGTGVFGGMLAATFIATVFIPLFFVLLSRRESKSAATPADAKQGPA